MKNFLKLIEVAKEKGILGHSNLTEEDLSLFKPDSQNVKALFEHIPYCQPFVFSQKGETTDIYTDDVYEQDGELKKIEFGAPFRVFSVEMLDGNITSPRFRDITEFGSAIYIKCIVCVEDTPGEFFFFSLVEVRRVDHVSLLVLHDYASGLLVKSLIERMNKEETALENVRTTVKLPNPSGSGKYIHRIRKVIHVCPKKSKQMYEQALSHKVEWSHRWFVRGHWRRLPEGKLGKNREGIYCVSGNTWVTEFEKGPEGAPLIHKVRVVE